eukprot:g544.t1
MASSHTSSVTTTTTTTTTSSSFETSESSPLAAYSERKLRKLFQYLDVDGSGDLDKDEFERAFFYLEIHLSNRDLDRLFAKHCGPTEAIDYPSFRRVLYDVLRAYSRKRSKKEGAVSPARKIARGLQSFAKKAARRVSIWRNNRFDDSDKIRSENEPAVEPESGGGSETRRRLKAVFDHMDRDGSGDVDREEMITTLRHLGMYRSESQVDRMFQKFTGSPHGNAINFDQFCRLITHKESASSAVAGHDLDSKLSFSALGKRISRRVMGMRATRVEIMTCVVELLQIVTIVVSICETVFYVCMMHRDFEPVLSTYGIDAAWLLLRSASFALTRLSYRSRSKIAPLDDEDDDNDDDGGGGVMKMSVAARSCCILSERYAHALAALSLAPFELLACTDAGCWTALYRCNRLLRVALIVTLYHRAANFLEAHRLLPSLNVRATASLFVMLGFLAHLHGCVFYLAASLADGDSWASEDGLWTTETTSTTSTRAYLQSLGHRYVRSLYWAIVTLLTVGFGDVVPRTASRIELGITLWTMYTGAAVSCAIVGCIVHAFSDTDTAEAVYRERREGISTYMRGRELPMRLQRRILDYFDNMESVMHGAKTDKIERHIPRPLCVRMMRHAMHRLLDSVDSLRLVADARGPGIAGIAGDDLYRALKNEVAEALMESREVFSPGQIVKRAGDSLTGLYVLSSGIATVETDVKLVAGDAIEERLAWRSVLVSGEEEGEEEEEEEELSDDDERRPQQRRRRSRRILRPTLRRTVRAKTYCTFFFLSTERFKHCLTKHLWPKQMRRLRDRVTDYFELKEKVRDVIVSTAALDASSSNGDEDPSAAWLIHPESVFRDIWRVFLFFCVVAQMALFPTQLIDYFAPAWPTSGFVRIACASLATDLIFTIDIALNSFFFAFTRDGVLVTSRSKIWKRYASSWFWTDALAASATVRYVALLLGCSSSVFVGMSLVQVLRWVHVIEYASKASAVVQERTYFDVNVKYRRFVQMYILLIMLLHWGANLWIWIGNWSVHSFSAETSWMTEDRTDVTLDMSENRPGTFAEYVRAAYFVAVAVSTVGYGDIRATNTQETWAAVFLLYIIGFVYPALIGCIASLISSSDDARAASRRHAERATDFLVATATTTSSDAKNGRMMRKLRARMTAYIHFIQSGRDHAGNESRILELLPAGLRMDVAAHIARTSGNQFFVIDTMESSTMSRWMLSRMRPRIYLPSDNVLVRGESFDRMFVVDKGALAMHRSDTGRLIALYGVGRSYGEHALLRQQVQYDTLWSIVFSTLMVLSRDDFRSVVHEFPREGREMVNAIRERSAALLNTTSSRASRKMSRRLQSRRSASSETVMDSMTPLERAYVEPFLGKEGEMTKRWGRSLQNRIRRDESTGTYMTSFGHPLTLDPFRVAWDVTVFAGIAYDCVTIPLYLCVSEMDWQTLEIVSCVVDAIYTLHVIFSIALFSVMVSGLVVPTRKSVAFGFNEYRQLVAAAPIFWIVLLVASSSPLKFLHVLKILRFPDAANVWSRIETAASYASLSASATTVADKVRRWRSRAHITRIFSMLLVLAHYAALLLYSMAAAENDVTDSRGWNGTWVSKQIENAHVPPDGGSAFVRYSRALYWAVSTMVVVVIGDVTPVNIDETHYVLAIVLIGVVINATIIGNLISLRGSSIDLELQRRTERVRAYMEVHRFPSLLSERVLHALAHQWDTARGRRCLKQLEDDRLPKSLRLAAKSHLGGGLLFRIPAFASLLGDFGKSDGASIATSSTAIKRLLLALDFVVYMPGDTICEAHDRASRLFVVRSGLVRVVSPVVNAYLASRGRMPLPDPALLEHGTYFGEISLANVDAASGAYYSYGHAAEAHTFVELCVLRRADFLRAMRDSAGAHVDIVCRIESWAGWQWLEQLSSDAASVMSQSRRVVATDREATDDHRRGSGSILRRPSRSGYSMGRHNKASRRRSTSAVLDLSSAIGALATTSASVGCEMVLDDEVEDEDTQRAATHSQEERQWMYENTSIGRAFRRLSSHRVPYITLAKRLSKTISATQQRQQQRRAIDAIDVETWRVPPIQRAWNVAMLFLSTYAVVATSYHASTARDVRGTTILALDSVVDVLFIVDLYVRARRMWVVSDGLLLRDPSAITAHFLSTTSSYADAALSIPLSLLYRVFGGSDRDAEIFLRLPQLMRVLALRRTHDLRRALVPRIGFAVFDLVRVIATYVLVNHLCACVWVALRRYVETSADVRTWATRVEDAGAAEDPADLYVHAFYFVVTCMSTVGYGDVRPYTTLETYFNTLVCMIGSILFAFLIGAFQSIFAELHAFGVSTYGRQQDELRRYMDYHSVPLDLRRTVREHLATLYESNGSIGIEVDVLRELPDRLREDLALHLYGDVLSSVSFVAFWTEALKKRLARYLGCVYFCANDAIFSRTERGTEMFIVVSGRVNYIVHRTVAPRKRGRRRRTMQETFELSRGDYFGETVIVGILENRFNCGFRSHSACAITACQLLHFDAKTMQTVLSVVPVSQRTFILQQLSMDTAKRFRATGGTSWLQQCHAAYVSDSRGLARKGTGTSVHNLSSFQRKPLTSGVSNSNKRRTRRASFNDALHLVAEGRKLETAVTPTNGSSSSSIERTERSKRTQRLVRRASFSAVALPSAIARRRRSDASQRQEGIIRRSLSFIRSKSTDLVRSMSGTSASFVGSVGSRASSFLDFDESVGGEDAKSAGGSSDGGSGRLTPFFRKMIGNIGIRSGCDGGVASEEGGTKRDNDSNVIEMGDLLKALETSRAELEDTKRKVDVLTRKLSERIEGGSS